MLDFYIIQDGQPQPDYPEQAGLEFVGGLDRQTFDHLKNSGVIGLQHDFYTDLRLDAEFIKQIRQYIFKKRLQADADVRKLLLLLDMAEQSQSGLIAYAD
ncbi:hypothetical protein LQ567_01545 [Niabella pedocola]|uniref:Uncharacterized protein n=1 Tax=Niabella pedocola TaxID=1752077 RepID=A0ABS8PK02_9BACT|nr:hypothetical protein [Niabella pedocola]MCD2421428.1 hypothetical protein [Niabella pedocola]